MRDHYRAKQDWIRTRLEEKAKAQTITPSKADAWLKQEWEKAGLNLLHPKVADRWNVIRAYQVIPILNTSFKYAIHYQMQTKIRDWCNRNGYASFGLSPFGVAHGELGRVNTHRLNYLMTKHGLSEDSALSALTAMTIKPA